MDNNRKGRIASDLLKRTGEALYGPHWLSCLPDELGMPDDLVLRIAAGEIDMPKGMASSLWQLALERHSALEELSHELLSVAQSR